MKATQRLQQGRGSTVLGAAILTLRRGRPSVREHRLVVAERARCACDNLNRLRSNSAEFDRTLPENADRRPSSADRRSALPTAARLFRPRATDRRTVERAADLASRARLQTMNAFP